MKDLRDYLQKTLSWHVYENLHVYMLCTKTRITQIQNNPKGMELAEIVKLSSVINNKDMTGADLLANFDCGKETITLTAADTLQEMKDAGMEVTLKLNAFKL